MHKMLFSGRKPNAHVESNQGSEILFPCADDIIWATGDEN